MPGQTKIQIIIEQIRAIEEARGRLIPEDVVEAAQPRNHPLHNYFEWDNRRAGHLYRLDQARGLIRSVMVDWISPDENLKVRQYHAVRHAGADAPAGYVANEEIALNPSYRLAMERQMQRDLIAFRRRYASLERYWEILTEVLELPPGDQAA